MRPSCTVLAIFLGALLAACAATRPPLEYALSARPASSPISPSIVRLGRVSIPVEIDRLQIVRYRNDNWLDIDDQHAWAAPLRGMVSRVMRANLESRTRANIDQANMSESQPARSAITVDLDLDEIYIGMDCRLRLHARWTEQREGMLPRSHVSTIERDGRECAASDVPAALSDALGDLSDRIVRESATTP